MTHAAHAADRRPSPNPTGGRARTVHHRLAEEAAGAFAGLPPGATKFTVTDMLDQAGHEIGFTAADVRVLRRLVKPTSAGDWLPGGDPMNWEAAGKLAKDLNMSTDTLRRICNRLMRKGAIAFHNSPNNRRYARVDKQTGRKIAAYGIKLGPAAALIPRLTLARERQARDREDWLLYREAIGAQKRAIEAALGRALDEGRLAARDRAALGARLGRLGLGISPHTALDELKRRLAGLRSLDRQLGTLVDGTAPAEDGGSASREPKRKDENTPARAGQYACLGRQICMPPYNPTNTNPESEPNVQDSGCQESVGGRAARAGDGSGGAGAGGMAEGISLKAVLAIVPASMTGCLTPGVPVGWPELAAAAAKVRANLGVHESAWREARDALGGNGAAAAMAVTAERHRRGQVQNPGGYLRELARRAARGALDLPASIRALGRDAGDGAQQPGNGRTATEGRQTADAGGENLAGPGHSPERRSNPPCGNEPSPESDHGGAAAPNWRSLGDLLGISGHAASSVEPDGDGGSRKARAGGKEAAEKKEGIPERKA